MSTMDSRATSLKAEDSRPAAKASRSSSRKLAPTGSQCPRPLSVASRRLAATVIELLVSAIVRGLPGVETESIQEAAASTTRGERPPMSVQLNASTRQHEVVASGSNATNAFDSNGDSASLSSLFAWRLFGAEQAGGRRPGHLLILFALLVLINLCVILGNILVILAVYATVKLRSVTNIFIVSLATADLLLGLFVLPYSLMFEILDVWIFGKIWCRGWLVADVWICTASILNLCAISVDRYVAVTRPVKYRYIMTPRKAKSIVAGVWIVSFLICFPPLLQLWKPTGTSSTSSTTTTTASPFPSLSLDLDPPDPEQQQPLWSKATDRMIRRRRHVASTSGQLSSAPPIWMSSSARWQWQQAPPSETALYPWTAPGTPPLVTDCCGPLAPNAAHYSGSSNDDNNIQSKSNRVVTDINRNSNGNNMQRRQNATRDCHCERRPTKTMACREKSNVCASVANNDPARDNNVTARRAAETGAHEGQRGAPSCDCSRHRRREKNDNGLLGQQIQPPSQSRPQGPEAITVIDKELASFRRLARPAVGSAQTAPAEYISIGAAQVASGEPEPARRPQRLKVTNWRDCYYCAADLVADISSWSARRSDQTNGLVALSARFIVLNSADPASGVDRKLGASYGLAMSMSDADEPLARLSAPRSGSGRRSPLWFARLQQRNHHHQHQQQQQQHSKVTRLVNGIAGCSPCSRRTLAAGPVESLQQLDANQDAAAARMRPPDGARLSLAETDILRAIELLTCCCEPKSIDRALNWPRISMGLGDEASGSAASATFTSELDGFRERRGHLVALLPEARRWLERQVQVREGAPSSIGCICSRPDSSAASSDSRDRKMPAGFFPNSTHFIIRVFDGAAGYELGAEKSEGGQQQQQQHQPYNSLKLADPLTPEAREPSIRSAREIQPVAGAQTRVRSSELVVADSSSAAGQAPETKARSPSAATNQAAAAVSAIAAADASPQLHHLRGGPLASPTRTQRSGQPLPRDVVGAGENTTTAANNNNNINYSYIRGNNGLASRLPRAPQLDIGDQANQVDVSELGRLRITADQPLRRRPGNQASASGGADDELEGGFPLLAMILDSFSPANTTKRANETATPSTSLILIAIEDERSSGALEAPSGCRCRSALLAGSEWLSSGASGKKASAGRNGAGPSDKNIDDSSTAARSSFRRRLCARAASGRRPSDRAWRLNEPSKSDNGERARPGASAILLAGYCNANTFDSSSSPLGSVLLLGARRRDRLARRNNRDKSSRRKRLTSSADHSLLEQVHRGAANKQNAGHKGSHEEEDESRGEELSASLESQSTGGGLSAQMQPASTPIDGHPVASDTDGYGEEGARKKSGCDLFDDRSYVIYSALGSFYIPMLVMIFFYSRIYLVASRAQKARQRGYMTAKWPTGSARGRAGEGTGAAGSAGEQAGGGCEERVILRIHRREKSPVAAAAAATTTTTTTTTHERTESSCVLESLDESNGNNLATTDATARAREHQSSPVVGGATDRKPADVTTQAAQVPSSESARVATLAGTQQQASRAQSAVAEIDERLLHDADSRPDVVGLAEANGAEVIPAPSLECPANDVINVGQAGLCNGSAADGCDRRGLEKLVASAISQDNRDRHRHRHRHHHHHHRRHHHHHHHCSHTHRGTNHRHHHHHHQHSHHDLTDHQQHQHHRHHRERSECQRGHLATGRHATCAKRLKSAGCALHGTASANRDSIAEEAASVSGYPVQPDGRQSHEHQDSESPPLPPGEREHEATADGAADEHSSVNSIQINVSRYLDDDDEDEDADAGKMYKLDVVTGMRAERSESVDVRLRPDDPSSGSLLNPIVADEDGKLRRVERTHSCGVAPSIVVNWDAKTSSATCKAAGHQASASVAGSPFPGRAGSQITGSQGSGLGLIASLPSAANQMRKQSIMLLSTLTSRSGQTLRRLSMVAAHPMESLLKRSRSRDSDDDNASKSSDLDLDTINTTPVCGLSETDAHREKSKNKKKSKKKKGSKVRKRRGSLFLGRRNSQQVPGAPKRTLDDYLMAVAGIDSSSDADERPSDNGEDEDDDDDDDDDEEEYDDNGSRSGNESQSHYPFIFGHGEHKLLVPGIRVSMENIPSPTSTSDRMASSNKVAVEVGQSPAPPTPLSFGYDSPVSGDQQVSAALHSPQSVDNMRQVDHAEPEEAAARPPSALHRQGAYYERATSRSTGVEIANPGARPMVDGVVGALKRSINGIQKGGADGSNLQAAKTHTQVIATAATGKTQIYHHHVMKKPRRRGAKRTSRWYAKRLHAETRAAKTLALIIGGFITCWLPFFTCYIGRVFCERPHDCINPNLVSLTVWLGYTNSAINPIIYGLFSNDFRHAFKNILCRCRFRNTDDTVVVSVLVDSIIKSIL